MKLYDFLARHAKPFFLDFVWIFPIVVAGLAASLWAGLIFERSVHPKEPQLYTVHFDGIEYQDLQYVRSGSYGSIYRTKTGKRILFKGNFYEVEQ